MTDRKLLELAPGSRWVDGAVVSDGSVDLCASSIFQRNKDNPTRLAAVDPEDEDTVYFDSKDMIALLHRAGLLDELLAEAWDEGRECGWDNAMDEAHYERPYPHKNPYRKAGK